MVSRLRRSLSESGQAFREVFRNRNLRRLELAWIGSITGEWGYGVALAVYAYREGGAAAVSVVAVIKWVPSAIAAPFLAMLGDRFRRERVLLYADLSRALAMTAMAVVALGDGPAPVVYALAGFVSLASKTFRPAQAALLPSLARTPQELTASNVASSAIESTGSFVGPAVGGLVLVATSPGVVFGVTAATFVWSALLVAGIRGVETVATKPLGRGGIAREALAGFRAIGADRDLRLLVGLYAAQTLVAGALSVIVVVAAIELLDLGQAGVGFLNSAVGVGGLVGAVAAFALVARKRLATDFGVGIVLWGASLALIGVWPEPAVALFMLGVLGVGNTLVDIAGVTLLQRAVSEDVLARVFGALESLLVGTLALGAVLAPVAIELIGIRGALIVAGSLLPLAAALTWTRLVRLDAGAQAPEERIELLRANPIFSALPQSTLEGLASALDEVQVGSGELVFRQGDEGDLFYIVESGQVEVSVDGRGVSKIGPGGYFGEVALLRDVPRTASVRANGEAGLLVLERDTFIRAVTGHARSIDAANTVIGVYRLSSLRTQTGAA